MKTVALALTAALMTVGAAVPALATPRNHGGWDQRNQRDQWNQRNQRDDWRNLGVVHASGNDDTLVLDRRTGRIDDLRIEATRGAVNVRSLVVTTVDGRRYVVPVNQQVRPGNAQFVDLPGPAQRLASVELQYAGQRGGFFQRAFFGRNRADVVMFGR